LRNNSADSSLGLMNPSWWSLHRWDAAWPCQRCRPRSFLRSSPRGQLRSEDGNGAIL